MKRHKTEVVKEELLARVLEECLEEDLSFVPPDREIERAHRFSREFESSMDALLRQNEDGQRRRIRRHFAPAYGRIAACVLVFCVCGWLFYQTVGRETPGAGRTGLMEGSATEESAQTESEGSAEIAGSAADQETAESAEDEAAQESGAASGSEPPSGEGKLYCGRTVYPAAQQDVAETMDYVTTLVNCPVLDEENPVIYLTIGNIGEETIRYENRASLEVWLEDGWYVIPSDGRQQAEWVELEGGMAVDEEIDLSDYRIDYGAQQYRLTTRVDGNLISAEFTFEEVFAERMEELQRIREQQAQ